MFAAELVKHLSNADDGPPEEVGFVNANGVEVFFDPSDELRDSLQLFIDPRELLQDHDDSIV